MDFLHSLLVTFHLIGMALLVGTFLVQMRAQSGFNFPIMLSGAFIQIVTGASLFAMAMAGDGTPNQLKLAIKALLLVVVFVASLIGYLRSRSVSNEKASLQAGGAVRVGDVAVTEPRLKVLFHIAGGVAFVILVIAVFWH